MKYRYIMCSSGPYPPNYPNWIISAETFRNICWRHSARATGYKYRNSGAESSVASVDSNRVVPTIVAAILER